MLEFALLVYIIKIVYQYYIKYLVRLLIEIFWTFEELFKFQLYPILIKDYNTFK